MKDNGTPPHGQGDYEDEMIEYGNDDDDVEFNEDDMIEVIDDDENGNLADDEEDEDMNYGPGPGLEGFEGQKPQHILTSHLENAVFCCCFDTEGKTLVTGGEDDIANVWNLDTIASQSPSFKCRGHKDSVVNVSFNSDSSYLSTCDLSGIVKVWKTTNYDNVITLEAADLSWSFWHYGINVLFAGCEDGSIYMWKIPSGDCKIYTGSSTKCEAGILLPDGKRLLAGYTDGTLKLFDLKSGEVLFNFTKTLSQHSPVLCVAAHPSREIVASGGADGSVAVLSSQNGKLLSTLQLKSPAGGASSSQDDEGSETSVESLAFCPDPSFDYLACGSVTGDLVIWDLSNMSERMRIKQDAGISKLMWDTKLPLLYSSGLDGVVRVLDARSCAVEALLGRHKTEILDMAITKDGSKLASTSEDGSVFVFDLGK